MPMTALASRFPQDQPASTHKSDGGCSKLGQLFASTALLKWSSRRDPVLGDHVIQIDGIDNGWASLFTLEFKTRGDGRPNRRAENNCVARRSPRPSAGPTYWWPGCRPSFYIHCRGRPSNTLRAFSIILRNTQSSSELASSDSLPSCTDPPITMSLCRQNTYMVR